MIDSPNLLLVVDDDPDDFECLVSAAERADLELRLELVSSWRTLDRALDRFAHRGPVVVLMDLSIPIEDGFHLTRRLRRDERWRHVPILALSTASDRLNIERAYESGVSAFVVKPATSAATQAMLQAVSDFWFQTSVPPILPIVAPERIPEP